MPKSCGMCLANKLTIIPLAVIVSGIFFLLLHVNHYIKNMQPIDKFEWKVDADKEKELLEYISLLEKIYIPDFDYADDDPMEYFNITVISRSEVSSEKWEQLCNQPCQPSISEVLQTFTERYNQNLITNYFNYDGYQKHELIGKLIKELELDVNKFWMLILFIYDYSYHYYIEGANLEASPNEQLLNFSKSIIENIEDFDEKNGSTPNNPMSLTLCVEGKDNIIITNPTVIHRIASATFNALTTDNLENMPIMKRKAKAQTFESTKDSPFITFFAKMFLSFFDTQDQVVKKRRKGAKHAQKEIDLVCQLIAFTKLSTKECWKQTENDTLKAFLKQYKDFEPKTINSIYPLFRL